MFSPLASRETWEYPISAATALALLGGMGKHPDRPMDTQPLLDYEEVWVNLKTLFRNLYNAVNRQDVHSVKPAEFAQTLEEEMDMFRTIISDLSGNRIRVQYYICDYMNMNRHYPDAIIRGDNTDLQRAYTSSMTETLRIVINDRKEQILIYPLKITFSSISRILLMTHYALDLFSNSLRNRALFESHTGAVKEKHQWYTKYLNGKDIPMIPFREGFMQVFGDPEHFRPMGMGIKRQVLEVADKYSWNQLTTDAKIAYGVGQIKDHAVRHLLQRLIMKS